MKQLALPEGGTLTVHPHLVEPANRSKLMRYYMQDPVTQPPPEFSVYANPIYPPDYEGSPDLIPATDSGFLLKNSPPPPPPTVVLTAWPDNDYTEGQPPPPAY